ncbi:MAG: hypothetical protein JSR47_02405 [Proteobacteria bacterium]|nr:hypothetical protein [Pseudomonadota bacterium]
MAGLLLPRICQAQSLSLASGEVLRGRFTQQRFLQGFTAPLTSTGSFILAANRGLVWRGETPFALLTGMGPGGLVQRVLGGATTRYPASKLPMLAQLYGVFSAALEGDWVKLGDLFEIQREGTPIKWQVKLVPRKTDGGMPLQHVLVQGARFVNSVEVARVNQDRDAIEFSEQVISRDPIDSEASELLGMVDRP